MTPSSRTDRIAPIASGRHARRGPGPPWRRRGGRRAGGASAPFTGTLLQAILVVGVGAALGIWALRVTSIPVRWQALATVGLLSPFVLLTARNVRRFLLAVILMEITIPVDINLFYDLPMAQLNALGGLNISVTTIALLVLYGLWFMRTMVERPRPDPARSRALLPFAVYVAAAILSLAVARNMALAGFEIDLLVQAFLLFAYIAYNVRTRGDVAFVFTVLAVGLLVQSLIMLGVTAAGHSVTVGGITARLDPGLRVGGTVGSPNTAASYLTLMLAPALALALSTDRRSVRRLAITALVLGAIALLFTQSRGGWSGFAASMLVFLTLAARRGWLSLRSLLAIVFAVALLVGTFHGVIGTRVLSGGASDPETRVMMVRLAGNVIRDHPIFGVGANNFAAVIHRYVTPAFGGQWIHTVHNKYFLVWAETGAIGLVAFLWYLLSALGNGWRAWRRTHRAHALLALGLVSALVGTMVHMNVDLFNGRLQVQMIAVVAGLCVALAQTAGGAPAHGRSGSTEAVRPRSGRADAEER